MARLQSLRLLSVRHKNLAKMRISESFTKKQMSCVSSSFRSTRLLKLKIRRKLKEVINAALVLKLKMSFKNGSRSKRNSRKIQRKWAQTFSLIGTTRDNVELLRSRDQRKTLV